MVKSHDVAWVDLPTSAQVGEHAASSYLVCAKHGIRAEEDELTKSSEDTCAGAPRLSSGAANNDVCRKVYETPELVRIETAKKLLRGPTYSACYYDYGAGFSNYDQGRGSRC